VRPSRYRLHAVLSVSPPCRNREYSETSCNRPWIHWLITGLISIPGWTRSPDGAAGQFRWLHGSLPTVSGVLFIREHREQKLFFLARPDGHGYSRTSKPASLCGAHGIIPDGAKPAIRDHPASHPGCVKGALGRRRCAIAIKCNYSNPTPACQCIQQWMESRADSTSMGTTWRSVSHQREHRRCKNVFMVCILAIV